MTLANSNLAQAAGHYHSLPSPQDIHRQQLENGLIVLSRANFNSPSVVIQGFLQVGGLFDPDEKLGLADFTASALMRGTAQRDFQSIYDALESAGARLGLSGGTHTTSFHGKALAEDLGLILDLLAEVLRGPSFPANQVERLRSQLLTGLAMRAQDTGEMASLAFDQVIYRQHPYSRPEDGYPETIQAIHREDLIDFHQHFYGPSGMVIAVVGAVDPQEAVQRIATALGDWHNPQQPVPPPLPALQQLTKTEISRVSIPGKSQEDIVLGAPGPERRSTDYLAAALGNSVLGQFGMMGRIGEVVREQSGLAYYASSGLSGGIGPGPWAVSAGVDPTNVEQAIELIRSEIARFVSEPVSAQELSDNQAYFTGRLPLSLETNGGIASALLNLERYQLGLDYYQRYADLVAAITREDILAAAQHYLDPDRLGIAIAGP